MNNFKINNILVCEVLWVPLAVFCFPPCYDKVVSMSRFHGDLPSTSATVPIASSLWSGPHRTQCIYPFLHRYTPCTQVQMKGTREGQAEREILQQDYRLLRPVYFLPPSLLPVRSHPPLIALTCLLRNWTTREPTLPPPPPLVVLHSQRGKGLWEWSGVSLPFTRIFLR